MIKSELINLLCQRKTNMSELDIAKCTNLMLEYMSHSLCAGDRIEIRGFGSFSLHYRPPRMAHNPKTGDKVTTAPKYTPHFKPGKDLRERVNSSRSTHPIIEDDRDGD